MEINGTEYNLSPIQLDDFKHTTCMQCGHKLKLVSFEDELGIAHFMCENCGTEIEAYTPDEEAYHDFAYSKDKSDAQSGIGYGYEGHCLVCDSHLVWQSDFMRSETFGDVPITKESQEKLEELNKEMDTFSKDEAFLENYEIYLSSKYRYQKNEGDLQIIKASETNEDFMKKYNAFQRLKMEICNCETDYDFEKDSLSRCVTCPHCGTAYDWVDPRGDEINNYQYWKKTETNED